MRDESDIQRLLRLKRYEQPPPEYFEQFLREFQQRQRAEILREPLWKIAFNRLQALMSEMTFSKFAYAGATAAVLLIAGVTSFKIINGGNAGAPLTVTGPALAQVGGGPSPQAVQTVVTIPSSGGLSLEPRLRLTDWNTLQTRSINPGARAAVANPHYVIDARPVSYEPPSSF
jgi:hypothetical protein